RGEGPWRDDGHGAGQRPQDQGAGQGRDQPGGGHRGPQRAPHPQGRDPRQRRAHPRPPGHGGAAAVRGPGHPRPGPGQRLGMRTAMWVAGAELAGGGDVELVRNPATEEPLAEVPSATPEQVDRAVTAARAALPGWRRTPAAERGELLHGVGAWLRDHSDELGRLMATEGGKPLVENTDEVGWTANAFSYYAELGRHERGRVIPSVEDGQLALVLKEPVGVVAVIVPWNYPLLLLAWKVAPALAAGNTVVVKPSPYTPLSTLRLAEAFAGFPDGVVNLVTGGAEVGEALVVHGGTDLVAFTGSVATGQRIGALSAALVKRSQPALGGQDA